MSINLEVGPIVSLIAGILILIVPRLLNYIVAIYLIVIGLVGILGWSGTHFRPTGVDNGPVASAPVLAAVAVPAPLGTNPGRAEGEEMKRRFNRAGPGAP